MSTGRKRGLRSLRGAVLELPPGRIEQALDSLRRGDVLVRLAVCAIALLSLWALTVPWKPPFSFRPGYVPNRDIVSRIQFKQPDPFALREQQNLARNREPVVYRQDPQGLQLLRANLQHVLSEVVNANTLADLNPETRKQIQAALAAPANGAAKKEDNLPDTEQQEEVFQQFRAALGGAANLETLGEELGKVFSKFEQQGLLDKLPEAHGEGNRKDIWVYPTGRPKDKFPTPVADVLIGDGGSLLRRLGHHLPPATVGPIFNWLHPRLTSTLEYDEKLTLQVRDTAAAAVAEQFKYFEPHQLLALANKPLDAATLVLLELEHNQYVNSLTWRECVERAVAVLGLLVTIFVLGGYYLYHHERRLVTDLFRLSTLLISAVAAVLLVHWMSDYGAELIPLLLFGMTFAIAYHRDVALMLTLSMAMVLVTTTGHGLGEFMVLISVVCSAIVQLGHIRSRSKLLKVGAISALVAAACSLGVGLLDEQPLGWPWEIEGNNGALWAYATRNAVCTLAAGFLLTGLLPMIEKMFGVLTEISLLEWSDVSHPLLQELVRRAPGTYNHSINVASMAEAAAEAVGGCGLLVRVGAYFHDIGKMLKPNYFVENQAAGENRHDTLVPAMSTLIIIAHVKDGADLARQHNLPQPIIDFIEQHHGTTLVEYFFNRANKRSDAEGDETEVEESSYRYPGPKPQTIETAVLMIADAVESASRALVEPTPARIESLVEEISHKKLIDGQFSQCHMTLEQLRTIEDSLIKSLSAIYHGRVKYPAPASA
ncbi:MAG: HDIG domain-containing protein [Planctomycetes bacterium]|nr:HDIG domain-containing protein [Planctomycetota bacterium]